MIKILQVIGGMGSGGAETLIMNLYRNIDRSKIQFDFVVHTAKPQFYDDKIKKLGGQIFSVPRYRIYNVISYKKWWERFFVDHPEYKVVHGHIGSTATIYLGIAKKYGCFTIAHSHNTKNEKLSLRDIVWNVHSYPTRYKADYFFACSFPAAIDRFGKKIANSKRCRVFNNAIDVERFKYSPEKRHEIRELYKIGERDFVIGHVGRFSKQKNHEFLIEIFMQVYRIETDTKLLLVGTGELEDDIKKKCKKLNISDSVIFAGTTDHIEKFYSAMDIFCFPSLWEGFGNVTIEAQTNGLFCVVSDKLPDHADISAGLFEKLSPLKSADVWAERILSRRDHKRRTDIADHTRRAGFDILKEAMRLSCFYNSVYERYKNRMQKIEQR